MTDRRSMSSSNTLRNSDAPIDDRLAGTFARALKADALDSVQAAFLAQMAEDYQPEETPGLGAAALTATLADFWAFAAEKPGAGPAIRITRAGDYACVDIVQPDSPFLVDSVMAEIAELGPGRPRHVPCRRRGRARSRRTPRDRCPRQAGVDDRGPARSHGGRPGAGAAPAPPRHLGRRAARGRRLRRHAGDDRPGDRRARRARP